MHTPLTRPIEITLEKVAFDIKLDRQADEWASEVISQAYKNMPFLKSYEMDAEFDRIDGSRGYGLGKLYVYPLGMEKDAAIKDRNIVVFPLIVRQENLSPFDVFSHDGQLKPMTKEAVEQALFRPGIFGSPAKKGELTGGHGLGNHMAPPTTGTNRYNGGGIHKSAGVLSHVLPLARQTDIDSFKEKLASDTGIGHAFSQSAILRSSAAEIVETKEKTASDLRVARRVTTQPDVIQFVESGSGYIIKQANSRCFRITEMWRPDYVATSLLPKEKVAELREKGSLVITTDHTVAPLEMRKEAQVPQTVGVYNAYVGAKPVPGIVVPNMVDLDGRSLPGMNTFAAVNGHALQKVAGVHVKDITLSPCTPRGRGVFVSQRGVEGVASEPVEITNHIKTAGAVSYIGTRLFSGAEVKLTPSSDVVGFAKVASDHYLIPDSMVFLPLQGHRINVQESPEQIDDLEKVKTASASRTIRVVGDGSSFSISGPPAQGVSSNYCSRNEAALLLGAFGVSGDHIDTVLTKAASVSGNGVVLHNARPVVPEETAQAFMFKVAASQLQGTDDLRRDLTSEAAYLVTAGWSPKGPLAPLVKTASVVVDKETVDSVLSLQFITPENVTAYIDSIPDLEKCANRLAEIVVASRMGMDEVRENAATRAMKSLSDVIDGLSSLRHKIQ